MALFFSSALADSDPYPIEYISSTLWTGGAEKAVQGDYLYLGMRYGIMIVDISDPSIPSVVSTLEFYNHANSAAIGVQGDYLYAVNRGDSSFNTIDVSDPMNPVIVGSCHLGSYSRDMLISGQYAYITEYRDGIEVVDISDPENPHVACHIQTEYACEVVVIEPLLYVADYYSVSIIDITDLSEPATLSVYDSVMRATGVYVDGPYLYVADADFGLRILNVANPSSPVLVRDFEIEYCGDVLVIDGYAYVSGGSVGIQVYDVADPANPVYQTSISSEGWSLLDADGYLYVQEGWSELQIWDISAPFAYTLAGVFELTGTSVNSVDIRGDYAYVCAGEVYVIDVSNPYEPSVVYEYDTYGTYSAQMARVSGDYLLVVDGTGLEALDLSNPAEPAFVDRLYIDVSYISVDGDRAAVSNSSTMYIVDISDPTNLSVEGTYTGSAFFRDVKLLGDYAYLCLTPSGEDSELRVINVSDPSNPYVEGTLTVSYYNFSAIDVAGNYAYVHAGYWVYVIDVSDPASPTPVSLVNTGSVSEIIAAGDFAYMSTVGTGLTVADVYIPVFAQKISDYKTSGTSMGIAISGDYAYIADQYALLIFSAPSPEILVGDADGSGAIDVDDIVFLIDFIFSGGLVPLPTRAGDADSSGSLDIDDVVWLIAYVFGGGSQSVR